MANHDAPFRVQPEPAGSFALYDPRATECTINLVRAYLLVRPHFERIFRQHGLSVSTFNVLMILRGASEPLQPRVISDRLLVTTATVTGLLNSLDKLGFIRRLAHPVDRRMALVEITQPGLAALEDLLPQVYRCEIDVFSALSPDEKETLIALLGKVQSQAQRLNTLPPGPAGRGVVADSNREAE